MSRVAVTKHESNTQDWFDEWSESRTFARIRPWLAYVQDRVLDSLDWAETTRIIDVACGAGRAVVEAAQRMDDRPNALSIGCDLSQGMLMQSGAFFRRTPKTQLVNASAQSLPFKENNFDAVICTVAFHHFPDAKEALAEFRRVLRPGGAVRIADPSPDHSWLAWIWEVLHRLFEKGHVSYYRWNEMEKLLTEAGFRDVGCQVFHPCYKKTGKISGTFAIYSAKAPGRDEAQ